MLDFLKDVRGKVSGKRIMGYLILIISTVLLFINRIQSNEYMILVGISGMLTGLSVMESK